MLINFIHYNYVSCKQESSLISPGFFANLTDYILRIISDNFEDIPVPLSECTDTCWYAINSSSFPTVPFNASVSGRNVIGIGQPLLCTENRIGKSLLQLIICKASMTCILAISDLINHIINVTEFNKTFITLYSETQFEKIVVFCGDNATNLHVCAEQGRGVNNTVYLDTTMDYMEEYRCFSLYYYEIHTSTIIVFGFIISSDTCKSNK